MALSIGDTFNLTKEPISRTTLALFAGASGDHNPIHIDLDFVRKAGLDDVFAHGMLGMAYLGQLLTNNFSQEKIKKYLNQTFLMTYGDGLSNVNIFKLVNFHKLKKNFLLSLL